MSRKKNVCMWYDLFEWNIILRSDEEVYTWPSYEGKARKSMGYLVGRNECIMFPYTDHTFSFLPLPTFFLSLFLIFKVRVSEKREP